MPPKKVEFVSPVIQHQISNEGLSSNSNTNSYSNQPVQSQQDHLLDQVFVEPRRKTKINKALKTLNKRVSSIGQTISRTTGITNPDDVSDSDSINQEKDINDYFYGKEKKDSEFKIIHDSLVQDPQDGEDYDYDYEEEDLNQGLNHSASTSKPALNHYQSAPATEKMFRDKQNQWYQTTNDRPQVFLPRSQYQPYQYSDGYYQPMSQREEDYYRQYSQYQQQQYQQQLQQQSEAQRDYYQYQKPKSQFHSQHQPKQPLPSPAQQVQSPSQMHPQAAEFMSNTVSAQDLARIRRTRHVSDPVVHPNNYQPTSSSRSKQSNQLKSKSKPSTSTKPTKDYYTFGDDEARERKRKQMEIEKRQMQNQFWKQYIDVHEDQANDYPSPKEDERPGTAMSMNSFLSNASTPSIHSSVSQRASRRELDSKAPTSQPNATPLSPEERPSKFSAKGLIGMMKKPKKERELSLHEQIMSTPPLVSNSSYHAPPLVPPSPIASHHSNAVSHAASHAPSHSIANSPAKSHHSKSSGSGSTKSFVTPPSPTKSLHSISESKELSKEVEGDLKMPQSPQKSAMGEIYNTFANAGGYVYNSGTGLLGSLFSKPPPKSDPIIEKDLSMPVGPVAPHSVASTNHTKRLIHEESDSDIDDDYDAHSIIGDNSPPTSPILSPQDEIHRPSSPLELTKSQRRFQKTMNFLFQKPPKIPPAGTIPSDSIEDGSVIEEGDRNVDEVIIPGNKSIISKKNSIESLTPGASTKSIHKASTDEEQFSLEPLVSTFVDLFRNCARISFVLRPVDAVADAFPGLQNVVVVVELILLMWLLYQISIIIETIATAVKTFCMPVIIICRVLGITY